jgi:hypothetical protein
MSGIPHWFTSQHQSNLTPPEILDTQHFVQGPLTWLIKNPGRQLLTGSFHPIDDDLWYHTTYTEISSFEDFTQTICDASFYGHLDILKNVFRKNRSVVCIPSLAVILWILHSLRLLPPHFNHLTVHNHFLWDSTNFVLGFQ